MTTQLSVIIASINGPEYLEPCLDALKKQQGNINTEVIVADCVGDSVTSMMKTKHPDVKLISFPDKQSVPKLRATAIAQTSGNIIAVTEDHCIPPSGWYQSVLKAHSDHPAPAIGGSVDNGATKRLIDWAVFFCEYSNFISPVASGVVHDLPGPNVSYKRSETQHIFDSNEEEFWETFVHGAIESEGKQLWSDPAVSMIHKKHFTFSDFLSERFHYSRSYAGTRNKSITLKQRLIYLFGSPLLPPILMLRIFKRVWAKKKHLPQFAMSLPYLLSFMVAWSVGEVIGYATGPGDSALYLT
ncbi:MAG TPA: glycosyltransferase [Drouetiella sp.]